MDFAIVLVFKCTCICIWFKTIFIYNIKKKFKTPTRLETLMKEVPKLVKNNEIVGNRYLDDSFVFQQVRKYTWFMWKIKRKRVRGIRIYN